MTHWCAECSDDRTSAAAIRRGGGGVAHCRVGQQTLVELVATNRVRARRSVAWIIFRSALSLGLPSGLRAAQCYSLRHGCTQQEREDVSASNAKCRNTTGEQGCSCSRTRPRALAAIIREFLSARTVIPCIIVD